MMRSLAPDRERATLAVAAAALVLALPTSFGQIGAIVLGGLVGLVLVARAAPADDHADAAASGQPRAPRSRRLTLFFALLIGLPLLTAAVPSHALALFDAFYRAGSLVFGGGHVVLPLLQAAVVPPGWVAQRRVPRRLRRGAGGAGTAVHVLRLSRHGDAAARRNGWAGAVALPGRHVPAGLPLVIGPLPFWDALRRRAVGAGGAARRQRRRGRTAARGALSAGLDLRHHQCRRFRARRRRPSCCCSCGGRRPGWWSSSARSAARRWHSCRSGNERP